jgi:hypothetical protein
MMRRGDADGISTVVGAILILALLVTVIAMAKLVYLPEMKRQAEADHMKAALNDFMDYKSRLDASSQNGRGGMVTGRIEMGGGSIPLIDPSKSSGTLTVDPSYGSLSVTAYFMDGSAMNTPDNLGTITYSSNNNYWIDQQFHYECGMVVLTQSSGSVMLAPPGISMLRLEASQPAYTLMVSPIRVGGSRASISSTGSEVITGTLFPERSLYYGSMGADGKHARGVDNVTISVTTDFAREWSQYFRSVFSGVGLKEGTDFNVTMSGRSVVANLTRPVGSVMYIDCYDSDYIMTLGSPVVSSGPVVTPLPSVAPTPTPSPTVAPSPTQTPTTRLSLSPANITVNMGDYFNVTVEVLYANGTRATTYTGTVTINDDDPGNNLKGDREYRFTSSDNGRHVFSLKYEGGEGQHNVFATDGNLISNTISVTVNK